MIDMLSVYMLHNWLLESMKRKIACFLTDEKMVVEWFCGSMSTSSYYKECIR